MMNIMKERYMPKRYAEAVWKGPLKEGEGTVKVESGVLDTAYDHKSRFETGAKTNPEELLGAAHAGCYAMFLSAILSGADAGYTVNAINTRADVTLTPGEGGPTVTEITLTVEGDVSGIDEATFLEFAERAKAGCPISKALASVPTMNLNATLVS
jgi:osmotically inducible protein OsmC